MAEDSLCHLSFCWLPFTFIRHRRAYSPPPPTVSYLRPFILAIPSAFLVHKYTLMHFDRILNANQVGARERAYSLLKALALEELGLEFGSPCECQEGVIAYLYFQAGKEDTEDTQGKLASQTSHSINLWFD